MNSLPAKNLWYSVTIHLISSRLTQRIVDTETNTARHYLVSIYDSSYIEEGGVGYVDL